MAWLKLHNIKFMKTFTRCHTIFKDYESYHFTTKLLIFNFIWNKV